MDNVFKTLVSGRRIWLTGTVFCLLFLLSTVVIYYGEKTSIFIYFILSSFLIVGLLYFYHRASINLLSSQKAIIYALANLAEWRDPDTALHVQRTRDYGVILAKELAINHKYKKIITADFIEDLYNASPLHDIGKVGIRDAVLLKDSRLTTEEFEEMKRHVVIARNILMEIINTCSFKSMFLKMSLNIAAYHHEKYDGTGYVERLKENEIPLEARIYALCDVYDAIRAKRPYKQPKTHDEAVDIIRQESGKHFDPEIVDAFLRCHESFFEIFETYYIVADEEILKHESKNIVDLNIQWIDRMSIGIEIVDNQHKELIGLINNMMSAIRRGEGREKIIELLEFIEKYITVHFNTEEEIMNTIGYPEYGLHIGQHVQFVEKFHILKEQHDKNGITSELLLSLNKYLISWLVNHILVSDKRLGNYSNNRGAG